MATGEECRERLERAGWSGLEACVVGPGGASWEVTISRGDEDLHGEGATPDEAWRDAWNLVEFVRGIEGLLPPRLPGWPA
jgi:hypothetical protein